jgi:integrase
MATPKKTPSGAWTVQIEVAGKRESATRPTKRECDEWAVDRARELKAIAVKGEGSVKTLRDALRKYAEEEAPKKKGNSKELVRLKAFEDAEKHPLPLDVKLQGLTPDDFLKWKSQRLKLNSSGTVLRDMNLLYAVFKAARVEWRWMTFNPLKEVSKPANPPHRERLISFREIRGTLRALEHRKPNQGTVSRSVADAFLLALATGMRAKEIANLTWNRVHPGKIVLLDTKTKPRDVSLSDVAERILERRRGIDSKRVFDIEVASLDAMFRKARKRAKLEGFTFHDARHNAASTLSRHMGILELCQSFGWSNPKYAMIYYKEDAAAIATRLRASIAKERGQQALRLVA